MEILLTKLVSYEKGIITVEQITFSNGHKVEKLRGFLKDKNPGDSISVYLWENTIPKIYYEHIEAEKSDMQIILEHIDNQPNSFFMIFGKAIDKDGSNIKVVHTLVIPNVNDTIKINKHRYRVTDRIIDYSQVENHVLDSDERGKESIYVFLEIL